MSESKLRMTITSFPDRKGRFLVIDDGDTMHIVARLQGTSPERQRRSELLIAQWCIDTGHAEDPIDTWCAERGDS